MSYSVVITTVGIAKLVAAQASGNPLVLSEMAVGDGGGVAITPLVGMTALVNERHRVDVNEVAVSASGSDILQVEGVIPTGEGGWYIREAGVFDNAGDLIAIASIPPVYKPLPAEGTSAEEVIQILIQYTGVRDIVELTADLSVVTATRQDVLGATAGMRALWAAGIT